jgi:hypothetical protein
MKAAARRSRRVAEKWVLVADVNLTASPSHVVSATKLGPCVSAPFLAAQPLTVEQDRAAMFGPERRSAEAFDGHAKAFFRCILTADQGLTAGKNAPTPVGFASLGAISEPLEGIGCDMAPTVGPLTDVGGGMQYPTSCCGRVRDPSGEAPRAVGIPNGAGHTKLEGPGRDNRARRGGISEVLLIRSV